MKKNNKNLKLVIDGSNSCEDWEWDDLIMELTGIMKTINPDNYWTAKVKNYGWIKKDGEKEIFFADTGKKLLQEILPDTECSFKIYKYKNGLAINNAHHDSPCWTEWYYVIPTLKSITSGELMPANING